MFKYHKKFVFVVFSMPFSLSSAWFWFLSCSRLHHISAPRKKTSPWWGDDGNVIKFFVMSRLFISSSSSLLAGVSHLSHRIDLTWYHRCCCSSMCVRGSKKFHFDSSSSRALLPFPVSEFSYLFTYAVFYDTQKISFTSHSNSNAASAAFSDPRLCWMKWIGFFSFFWVLSCALCCVCMNSFHQKKKQKQRSIRAKKMCVRSSVRRYENVEWSWSTSRQQPMWTQQKTDFVTWPTERMKCTRGILVGDSSHQFVLFKIQTSTAQCRVFWWSTLRYHRRDLSQLSFLHSAYNFLRESTDDNDIIWGKEKEEERI